MRQAWIEKKHMKVYSFIDNQVPPRNIDVMIRPPKNFKGLYHRRKIVKVNGVSVPLVPVHALIGLKKAAGRPQDIQDIEDLRLLGFS